VTLLFAYGSNLAEDHMGTWCPRYEFLGPARLDGFRLEFRRRSIRWRGGAADVVEAEGEAVWGALYELPDGELDQLDRKEAAGDAYRHREVEVEHDGERRPAVVYEVIDKEPSEPTPAPAYAEAMLRGAAERGLPAQWRNHLEHRLRELSNRPKDVSPPPE
jgi:cation transport regulator ChaC